jgi:hypothetical protein
VRTGRSEQPPAKNGSGRAGARIVSNRAHWNPIEGGVVLPLDTPRRRSRAGVCRRAARLFPRVTDTLRRRGNTPGWSPHGIRWPQRSGKPFANGGWHPPGTTSAWRIWLALPSAAQITEAPIAVRRRIDAAGPPRCRAPVFYGLAMPRRFPHPCVLACHGCEWEGPGLRAWAGRQQRGVATSDGRGSAAHRGEHRPAPGSRASI